ncbi:MAG: hypothetical protein AB8B56_20115 [Crocinitomicaceae bacterium]
MDKEAFLIFSITKFEEKAFEVITLMCNHFDLDIESQHPFERLQSRRTELWKGEFENWIYRFHGDSCEFIHSQTEQFLDLKIRRKGNYGAIDIFFLFKFIQSTTELNKLNPFEKGNGRHEVYRKLKEKKIVVNVGDEFCPIWILNKDAL